MANLKNTTINDAQFRLPVGDTAARAGSPNGREIRFNTETGKLEQFRPGVGDWIAPSNTGVIATGGDAVYDVDVEGTTFRVHTFTTVGTSTFTVTQGGSIEYLIVAGGGAGGGYGGNDGAGGGGAGGLITGIITVTPQAYTVTVGASGASATTKGSLGGNGGNSVALGLTAIGGGGGGTEGTVRVGQDGGSGGGAGGYAVKPGGAALQPSSSSGGFGSRGGDCTGPGDGGGGGAGLPGQSGTTGIGGNGLQFFISGIATFYAGGGGASGDQRNTRGAGGGRGGLGGGGKGQDASASDVPIAGTPSTGGGGGGAAGSTPTYGAGTTLASGAGGSGIVIIRYPLRQENPVTAPGRAVGNGLVLDLDFAKPTVYSGSGSTVSDSRLNGIVGTISGPDYINARSHRSAFSFDGGSDVIEIPAENAIMTTNGSLSFWLYADPTGSSYEGIIDSNFYSGSNGGWRFYRYDSVDIRMWESGNAIVYISNAITENAWQHLVLTRSGTTVKIYKNGGEIGSGTSTYGQWDGTLITLGTRYTGASARLNGDLGVVKFYNRAMLESEVEQEFNATRWRFGV